ncbi:hypothetical protein [Kitasatospora sp. NPDC058190]|uniref:hypothetical protein n=1 Tax=Kitasatospora sp. NPDC058190 TaxID=3346371 RepID=UPI0036DF42B6
MAQRPSTFMDWNEGARRVMEHIFLVGRDNHVRQGRRDPDGTAETATEVPGGAECISGVSAARLGYQDYTGGPGNSEYVEQHHELITCIGLDGDVWLNTSDTGGGLFPDHSLVEKEIQ